VTTAQGEIDAARVLVAAGGFTNSVMYRPLPLTVYARTICLVRVDDAEAARLAGMPSLIWMGPPEDSTYMLPPIRYPDGGIWLKIGGDPDNEVLTDAAAMTAWFRSGGNVAVADALEMKLRARLPGLAVQERRVEGCVTTFSPSDLPIIDRVSDRVAVATAGCGRGAKCSDELGRLGAEAVLGRCDPALAA